MTHYVREGWPLSQDVGQPCPRAFNPANIVKKFTSTGIHPFETSIFSDANYLGANVTDRPDPELSLFSNNNTIRDDSNGTSIAGPSCSLCCSLSDIQEKLFTTPEQLCPFPKDEPTKSLGGKRPAKSKFWLIHQ